MLLDFEFRNNNLICSFINKTGNIELKYFPWARPTKFIKCTDDDMEKSGKYCTWDGCSVKEVYSKNPNRYSVYSFLDNLPKDELNKIFDYNEPNIFFVDIENEILDSKPAPELAESMILSISIVNKERVLVMGLQDLTQDQINSIENNINNTYGIKAEKTYTFRYIKYNSEYEMILNFFRTYVPKMSVITGWNFIHYDWVFLVNRARKIGVDPQEASFTKRLVPSWKQNDFSEMPSHRLIVDYMQLYEKWDTSVKIKESSALDFVSENILGVKKVNYEGDLKHLYATNYKDFIYYNAVDSILVQMIHEKMGYVNIMYAISVLGNIRIQDALSPLCVTEGILRRRMLSEKNIVMCKNDEGIPSVGSDEIKDVEGGWVKEPIKGMSKWTTCYDFSSLYPSTMRQNNISPDTYKGQLKKGKAKDGKIYSIFNGHLLEVNDDDIICINNSVFSPEDSIIRKVITEIYADRKKYKKLMMSKHEELESMKNELKTLERELNIG